MTFQNPQMQFAPFGALPPETFQGPPPTIEAPPLELSLESLLYKEPNEDTETFTLRKYYTLTLRDLGAPYNQIDNATLILLGYLAIKKAQYGVKYDDLTEEVIERLNNKIQQL